MKHFKNYLYGTKFQIVSDHKALTAVLKSNKNNKTYSSRLTRWVDRLLPFEFEIVHAPGRTMGLADYISRHPSPIEGESVRATELWNNWFTVNHVNELNAILDELNQPIRSKRWIKAKETERKLNSAQVVNTNTRSDQRTNKSMGTVNSTAKDQINPGNQIITGNERNSNLVNRIGENILIANYQEDEFLQKIIKLLKTPNKQKIRMLDNPWREKFSQLSLDENNLIFMDDRLVIPKILQIPIKNSLHWGHPGRDQMLRQITDIWWPKIHRDITLLASSCKECQNAGKSIKTLLKQKEIEKLEVPKEINEEIAINFI